MEKLGVIGGMGAEATSYYYDQVVRHTAAACDQEHIDMVVLSKSTMPDRTLAIKTGEHAKLLATMKECAQALESLGCAHIAIPCNTSHYFYDQIQSFTKVPIIHMPRESVRYALAGAVMGECEFDPNLSMPAEPVHKIGIMGTDGTVGAGVYGRECKAAGVEVVYPSEKRQNDVMSLIYDDVKAGREPDMDKFDRVMWEFAVAAATASFWPAPSSRCCKSTERCPRSPSTPWMSWCANPSSAAAPPTASSFRPAKKGQVNFGRFYLVKQ